MTDEQRQKVYQHFNPRPREEGDLATIDNFVQVIISIHALVKRATILPCPVRCCALFQSTPS